MTSPNPSRLVESLRDSGWQLAGQKYGAYVRLAWPGVPNRSLLIPLDESAPEYGELLTAAVTQLERAVQVGQAAAEALATFRTETHTGISEET